MTRLEKRNHALQAEFRRFGQLIDACFETADARFETVDAQFAEVKTEIRWAKDEMTAAVRGEIVVAVTTQTRTTIFSMADLLVTFMGLVVGLERFAWALAPAASVSVSLEPRSSRRAGAPPTAVSLLARAAASR